MTKIVILLLLIFLLPVQILHAQNNSEGSINSLIGRLQQVNAEYPIEKVFLHLDKPWYYVNDTIWFKAYLFDAAYLSGSENSGLLYVEISSDSNPLIKRILLPVSTGLSWGNIVVDNKFPAGAYTIKAYTKWMLNFGDEFVFKKRFYVSDISARPWLISLKQEVKNNNGHTAIKIFNPPAWPVSSTPMQVRLMLGGRTIDRTPVITDANGNIDLNFPLPERNLGGKLSLSLQTGARNEQRRIYVPLLFNRAAYSDLQFLPESGNLIAGIPSRVGFKNIGEDGKGNTVKGKIVDQTGWEVTEFQSSHLGMGYFELIPGLENTYSAIIDLPDGASRKIALPQVKSSGLTISIDPNGEKDSIRIVIYCSDDVALLNSSFRLIAQSRSVPCWGANLLINKKATRLTISKNYFPEGITRFTLLARNDLPVAERICFVDHRDEMRIRVSPDKTIYSIRDSVSLQISATDKTGIPLQADLSVAVTDDNQVASGSQPDNTIVSYLLLSSDLKGNIEDAGYYFSEDSSAEIRKNLDILMLTQGWRGYEWSEIFGKNMIAKYRAEKEYAVRGIVLNIFRKPVKNTNVVLLSRKPIMVMDTKTNDSGVFVFNDLLPADTASFLIQARNPKGKSFNVGIEVDEFNPPTLSNSDDVRIPWYLNIDTMRLQALNKNSKVLERKAEITGKVQMLEEFVVIGKKVIRDSKNLNGPGESDFAMNAADLAKAGKATLGQIIEKNITGFRIGGKTGRTFMVNSMAFHLVIDGIVVDKFLPEGMSMFDYYRGFFDYYTAEDIKGVELMRSGKYQMSYTREYVADPLAAFYDHAFVEVTTYSGSGPFMKKLPGVYLYRPLPLTLPVAFYSPKYAADTSLNPPPGTDIRSTIHWEPNLLTDRDGKATLRFFTADYPGNYSIIIQGSDMNGSIGATRLKITVK